MNSAEAVEKKVISVSVTNLVKWAGFGFYSRNTYMNSGLGRKEATASEVSAIVFRDKMSRLRELQHCVSKEQILDYLSDKFIALPDIPSKKSKSTIGCVFKVVNKSDNLRDTITNAQRIYTKEELIICLKKNILCFASNPTHKYILEEICKPFSRSTVSIKWASEEARNKYILQALCSESCIKQLIIDNYTNQWLPLELGRIQEQHQLCEWGYQREFHKFLDNKYIVVGRVDKVEIRDGEMWIIEIKNRVKRFPDTPHIWEVAQCQIYMWLSNISKCCLEEHLFEEVRSHIIRRDDSLIQSILGLFLKNMNAFNSTSSK